MVFPFYSFLPEGMSQSVLARTAIIYIENYHLLGFKEQKIGSAATRAARR